MISIFINFFQSKEDFFLIFKELQYDQYGHALAQATAPEVIKVTTLVHQITIMVEPFLLTITIYSFCLHLAPE